MAKKAKKEDTTPKETKAVEPAGPTPAEIVATHITSATDAPTNVVMSKVEGKKSLEVHFTSQSDGSTVALPRTDFIRAMFTQLNMSRRDIQALLGGEEALQYQAVFAATKGMSNAIHKPGSTPGRDASQTYEYKGEMLSKRDYVRAKVADGVAIADLASELGLAKGTISQMASGVKRPAKPKKEKKAKKDKEEEGAVEEEAFEDDAADLDALDDEEEAEDVAADEDDLGEDLDDVFEEEDDEEEIEF